jgi:ParB family chromosome partitioning protein
LARKNPFANLRNDSGVREPAPALDYAMKGASRSILSSIDEMAARADKLLAGETIVDLDVDSVDGSFIKDRLTSDDQEFNELLEAIRERRPHPAKSGRYMVVYGHRRLEAAKRLGRKVRAVIKDLKDRDHVIAQGQENSARANLSFIEKALFAANLARLRYDDDSATILAALGVDRTTLSKMLSVAGLPEPILQAIGPAKGVGRDRWYKLKLVLEKPSSQEAALKAVAESDFTALSSDERFNILISRVKAAKSAQRGRSAPRKLVWIPEDASLAAEMESEGKRFTLSLKAKGSDAHAFGMYLSENLAQFYEAFRRISASNENGD